VLITGASTGIGRACALDLADRGFEVFATVRREADADRLAGERGERVRPLMLDVTDQESVDALADEVSREAPGGLAGLVNNAGVAVSGPLEFVPIDDLRHQLEVNVVGQVAVTQAVLPLIRRARGRIVNVGSSSGRMTTPFLAPYCAAKQGIEAISDALRLELRPWGIRVILVEPGAIDTPMWSKGMTALHGVAERMTPEGRGLYERQLAAVSKLAAEKAAGALPLERVTKVVAHSLTARRPRARYLIGMEDRMEITLSQLLPTSLFDAVLTRTMKL